MSDEKKLEALLSQNAAEVFDVNTGEAHVSDERLASDPLPVWTAAETAHFSRCEECRAILADRAVPKSPANVRLLYPRRLISFAAAAAAIFFGFLIFGRDPGMRSKGGEAITGAELTLIATSSTGVRRDLRDGGTLLLSDRLGFKYGNPDGKYKTISVLGYDGRTIHWYYPDKTSGQTSQPIEKTVAAGTRLPFDIGLADDHRPGQLRIVAAFDADPRVLAGQIERGTPPIDAQIFELEILGGPK